LDLEIPFFQTKPHDMTIVLTAEKMICVGVLEVEMAIVCASVAHIFPFHFAWKIGRKKIVDHTFPGKSPIFRDIHFMKDALSHI